MPRAFWRQNSARKRPRRDRLCAEGVRAARRKNLCRRLCAFGARHGTMAQTGAASSVLVPMGVPRVLAGVVFAGLLLFLRARRPAESRARHGKLVPFMAGCFFGVVRRGAPSARKPYPRAVRNMLKGAFSLKAGAGGVCGMILAMREGISRGVFTNEAGLWQRYIRDVPYGKIRPRSRSVHSALCRCLSTQSCCAQLRRCACWCHPCVIFSPEAALSVFSLVFGAVRRAFCRRMRGAFRVCIGFGVELLRYGRAAVFIAEKRRGGKENIHGVYGVFLLLGCMSPFLGVLNVCDAFNGLMALLNVRRFLVF